MNKIWLIWVGLISQQAFGMQTIGRFAQRFSIPSGTARAASFFRINTPILSIAGNSNQIRTNSFLSSGNWSNNDQKGSFGKKANNFGYGALLYGPAIVAFTYKYLQESDDYNQMLVSLEYGKVLTKSRCLEIRKYLEQENDDVILELRKKRIIEKIAQHVADFPSEILETMLKDAPFAEDVATIFIDRYLFSADFDGKYWWALEELIKYPGNLASVVDKNLAKFFQDPTKMSQITDLHLWLFFVFTQGKIHDKWPNINQALSNNAPMLMKILQACKFDSRLLYRIDSDLLNACIECSDKHKELFIKLFKHSPSKTFANYWRLNDGSQKLLKKLLEESNPELYADIVAHPYFNALFGNKQSDGEELILSLMHVQLGLDNNTQVKELVYYNKALRELIKLVYIEEQNNLKQKKFSFIHGQQRLIGFYEQLYTALQRLKDPTIPDDFLFLRFLTDAELTKDQKTMQTQFMQGIHNLYGEHADKSLFMNAFISGGCSAKTAACTLGYIAHNRSMNLHGINIDTILKAIELPDLYITDFFLYNRLYLLQQEYVELCNHGLALYIAIPETIVDKAVYLGETYGFRTEIAYDESQAKLTKPTELFKAFQNNPKSLGVEKNTLLSTVFDKGKAEGVREIESIDHVEFVMPLTNEIALNPKSGIQIKLLDPAMYDSATQKRHQNWQQRFNVLISEIQKKYIPKDK